MRGLKTLSVRLKQHEKSALKIANWLQSLDIVSDVLHPALHTHPQHEIWKRNFTGSAGVFSFSFKEEYSEAKLASFVNSLELFGMGYSWGGFKSLVTVAKYSRSLSGVLNKTLVRLNIGLEDVDDLIHDLDKSFTSLK